MDVSRKSTLVIDLTVLPSHPDVSDVQQFLLTKVKLNMSEVKILQFHNIRHCVLIEMVDEETARRYARLNNRKHSLRIDNSKFCIPIYVDDDAIDVRIHDLPPSLPGSVIGDHMKQYGAVHSIGWERWKNYFPGTKNGVRVVRMQITQPIPSYLIINNFMTLCSYEGQAKTCKFCHKGIHPNVKCGDVPATNKTTTQATNNTNFPTIDQSNTIQKTYSSRAQNTNQQPKQQPQDEQEQEQQEQQRTIDSDDNESSAAESTTLDTSTNAKRRMTTKKRNVKKPCQLNSPSADTESNNCIVLLSPISGQKMLPKNCN